MSNWIYRDRAINVLKRCVAVTFSFLIVGSLTACSVSVIMVVDGELDGKVEFRFYEPRRYDKPSPDVYYGKPAKVRVWKFQVFEVGADGSLTEVWHLRGNRVLAALEYGQQPKGLAEIVAPKPLLPGVLYRAAMSGSARDGVYSGSAGADVYFEFDESGELLPISAVYENID